MQRIILIFALSAFMLSCSNDDNKKKELELKEKELALKEKELSMKEKEGPSTSTDINTNASSPSPIGDWQDCTNSEHKLTIKQRATGLAMYIGDSPNELEKKEDGVYTGADNLKFWYDKTQNSFFMNTPDNTKIKLCRDNSGE